MKISSSIGSGLIAIILAGYLSAILYRGNSEKLVKTLGEEQGFVGWLAALVLWVVIRNLTSGNARTVIDAIGSAAMLTGLIIGLGKNPASLEKLQSGIHDLLQGRVPSGTSPSAPTVILPDLPSIK